MISKHNNQYTSLPKQLWRDQLYNLITEDNSTLVDNNNKISCKWLELVGDDALTFNQLLSTYRIEASQLIGIDIREENIVRCRELFTEVRFEAIDWNTFCRCYKENDIGMIVFDGFNSGYGNKFLEVVEASFDLAIRCKENLGECTVVFNVDSSKTYRGEGFKKGLSSREVLKKNIESVLRCYDSKAISEITVDVDSMYEYQQYKGSATMLSVAVGF